MNAPFTVRQLAQYGRTDAAIPGTVTLMQMGEAGTPYASILTRDLVTSALAGGGDLNLSAATGSINFLQDQGAGAVTLSVTQGELLVSTALRTSMVNATFVNAASVTVNGSPVVTQAQLAATPAVTSFNQRTGDVLLEESDILRAGGAPQANPHFSGWVTAPSFWDTRQSDDTVATTNWVHRLLCEGGVASFNGRHGDVILTTADVNAAYAVPGVPPTAPSPVIGDASDRIATTAFVDDTLEDYAPLYSPHLTGIPTSSTPPVSDNSNAVATTAFVNAAIGSNYHALGYVNIKDFGAKGDGVTNDSAAFLAFNAWAVAQTNPVVLFIPPGTYAGLLPTLVGPTQPRGGADFYRGVKDLTIIAYGATLSNIYRLSPLMVNQTVPETVSARLNAVALNSTSVTLQNAGDAANFAVGNWVMVSSLEMQGSLGFPPNWYYFDYAQIKTISGTTVTFQDALKFSHKTTYPQTVLPANVPAVGYDCGGPASMFLMLQDWDQNLKIMGMKAAAGSAYAAMFCARRVELIDCDFSANSHGSTATNSKEVIFQRCTMGIFTSDKIVSLCRLENCKFTTLHITTGSFDKILVDSCDIPSIDIGLGKHTVIRNSNIANFALQQCGFGAAESLIIEDCQIGNISYTAPGSQAIALSLLTFTNGTFSMPLTQTTANLVRFYAFAIPGAKCFFAISGASTTNMGNPFVITAVYQDAVNVYFDTTLTALPNYTGTISPATHLATHPCARLTGRNITGAENAVQLGRSGAVGQPQPAWSYARKVYSSDLVNPAIPIRQWGTFVQMTVNVIRADTGGNSTLKMNPLGQYGANRYDTSNAYGQYNPAIDLKTVGLRTITATAVTGNVGTDTIAVPGTIWLSLTGLGPYLTGSLSANTPAQMPVVEVELITDQGVTAYEYNAL